ncbi:MAG: hypothetical protein ACRD92_02725 [Nitrosopumilaceae archaeon]
MARKRLQYTPRRFTNEVEGWWFKGLRKPLTDQEFRNLFDLTISFTPPEQVDHTKKVLLGVDWGGGEKAYTIAWIWQVLDDTLPRFKLLYVTRITERSTEKQADMIAELMNRYGVDQGVMDAGGGTRQVQKLGDMFATRMYKATYMVRPEDPFEIIYKENRIIVDRTWAIESIIDLITRPETNPAISSGVPRIFIPAKELDKVEWLIDQFTCIEAESISLPSGKKYVKYIHPEESPDDALHACIYAYLAWSVEKQSRWVIISA